MKKSMKKINFSVLLSVYFKEKPEFLKSAIDSIYNNTLLPTEVILICDGNLTSELNKEIKKLEKKYNSLFIHRFKQNRGLGAALADGIKFCKYEYVARMDTDDICHEDRFEKQISYLIQHPETDMIGSSIIEYDESMSKILDLKDVPEKDKDIKKYMKRRNPFNHMSVIFKKSKVLDAGNYESMLFFEDYYLWSKLAKNGCSFYNFKEPLIDARGGIEMVSRRGGIKYVKCIIKFQKSLLKLDMINYYEFFSNLIIRVGICLLPNKIRQLLYQKKLRREVSSNV